MDLGSYQKLKEHYLTVFFHELGHVYCWKNDVWYSYHHFDGTKEKYRVFALTGFKAEKWVDKWGEKEHKKYFPKLYYCATYRTKEHKKWFKNNILKQYK